MRVRIGQGPLLQLAGYLVKFKGFDPNSINLLAPISGSNPFDYIAWYINRTVRPSFVVAVCTDTLGVAFGLDARRV